MTLTQYIVAGFFTALAMCFSAGASDEEDHGFVIGIAIAAWIIWPLFLVVILFCIAFNCGRSLAKAKKIKKDK